MSQEVNITFDTLSYVKALESAGMPRSQAEALASANFRIFAELITSTLATKTDIKVLETEMRRIEADLKKDIQILRADLARDIAQVKVDVLRWVVPLLIGQTAVLAALIKLL